MSAEFDFSFDRPILGSELLDGCGPIARSAWISRHVREDDVYFMQDGTFSQLLFKEVLNTFLSGHFIAVIFLGFSLIERTVAGRLAFSDKDKAVPKQSIKLLKAARVRNWITEEEYSVLDKLRMLRNPVVHFKEHLSEGRPELRAAINACTMEQQLEADAKGILLATIKLLQKTAL